MTKKYKQIVYFNFVLKNTKLQKSGNFHDCITLQIDRVSGYTVVNRACKTTKI